MIRKAIFSLTVATGALLPPVATANAVLVGSGTFNVAGDLTRILVGATVLEFLDLSATMGLSPVQAVTNFSGGNFHWANGSEVSALFSAFNITYAIAANPSGHVTDLGARTTDAENFVSYFGLTTGSSDRASAGWIDDMNTATAHTYSCISVNHCLPATFVRNSDEIHMPNSTIGVFLVRNDVSNFAPEPASTALAILGLAGIGLTRRRRA